MQNGQDQLQATISQEIGEVYICVSLWASSAFSSCVSE